ncbi:SRPBCC family protein [Pedobacter sp. SYP-B3415]|uniref:SRPBCC family protein n=1 Tax=Pedobacter sp. SYP-B3415 TaxID=2496641 RepID=UPI00101C023B|nr:SRPBCC family protein [Pedobacter sp. SYP-B3415]
MKHLSLLFFTLTALPFFQSRMGIQLALNGLSQLSGNAGRLLLHDGLKNVNARTQASRSARSATGVNHQTSLPVSPASQNCQPAQSTAGDSTRVIKKSRMISAAPGVVWRVLTQPESQKKWLGADVESDWKPDSTIRFSFTYNGKLIRDKGVVLAFQPEKKLAYLYWSMFSGLPDQQSNYSKIEFELSPESNGTVLILRHSNLATAQMYEHSDKNWEETLDQIKSLAEGK